jgi:hypothetical protein
MNDWSTYVLFNLNFTMFKVYVIVNKTYWIKLKIELGGTEKEVAMSYLKDVS